MKYSLFDLMDRRSILQLKIEKITDEIKQKILKKEFEAIMQGLDDYIKENACTKEQLEKWHSELYRINSAIWDLEAKIGEANEGKLSFEEVGKTALEIRKKNGERIAIKNSVVEITGVGHKEIKMYHASAEPVKKEFSRFNLKVLPLSQRESKSEIKKIAVNPDSEFKLDNPENNELIEKIAKEIIKSRKNNKPVILAFGAHLIKNGLSSILRKMIEENYITHLATNGAGSIHDWEFAFQGKSEEDVEKYVKEGQFGIWEETGKYINLALISGAINNKGYGESIGEMIYNNKLVIPDIKNEKLAKQNISSGELIVNHPFKEYSVQESAYKNKIPFTIHPGFGYDCIYTHPLNDGASIGKCAEVDFLKFAKSIYNLEGGVYLSIGSAIMSPMIFEKSLSMARNLAKQEGREIKDFMIVINDIQKGEWDWTKGEPPKTNPAYYLRFCKSFSRMGAREMHYIEENNKDFLLALYNSLNKLHG
jgi:hypothetical protein